MLKLFVLLGVFFFLSHAQAVVNIDTENVKLNHFKLSYYLDKTAKMSLDEVKTKEFSTSVNKISLGKISNQVWIKIVLRNITDKKKKLFIHNPFAYTSEYINFFELKDDLLIRRVDYDLNTKDGTSKMYGSSSIFKVDLQPNQTKTIFIKNKVFAYQYFAFFIYDENNSKRAINKNKLDIALLVGILIALGLYNVILFISSKHKENFYYSLYLLSASIWIANTYGLVGNAFGIYGEVGFKINGFLLLLPIFIVLFIKNIFNTKMNYKLEDKLLNSVMVLFTLNLIYGFYDFAKALELFSNFAIYMILVFLFVSISIYKKGDKLAKYFLIGHLLFVLFSAISILFYQGFIEFNYFTSHAAGFGIAIEALMFAIMVSYKIKLLEDNKVELLSTLEEKVNQRTAELEYSNYEFEHVLNNTMEGIAIFKENKCIDVNRAALKLYGFKNISDVLGMNVLDFIAPRSHEKAINNLSSNHTTPYEIFGIKQDGREFPILAKGHDFVHGDRKLRITSVIDLSEIKNKERELSIAKEKAEESTRIKSSFLANMSHEIRTPMNGIIGMTHLVKQMTLDEKQLNYIKKIENSSNNLLGIINDILDFSKIEAGKLEIENIDFDMSEVIQNVRNLVEFKAKEKGLEFSVLFSNKSTVFYGDSLRIGQILINLLNNAIKFTNKGKVELDIKCLQNEIVQFTVSDTGIGLTKEQQVKLFKSFSQADISTTRKYGGTGLGLSVSKQLVELMDGIIWVQSEEGEGSDFIFEIKLPHGDVNNINTLSDDISTNNLYESMQTLKGSNILLVEDNSTNREITHALLEHSQINIDDAFNGAMALSMFKQKEYELILMDIQMPIMDGYEATLEIRKINKDIPIIALTANAMKEDVLKTQKSGMNEHLNKPIEVEKLYETLLKYISVKKQTQDIESDTLEDDIKLPQFSTLNVTKALKHLGGNKKLFIKILQNFYEEYKNINLEEFGEDEFAREVHTLKGISANIGATDLHKVTIRVEEQHDKTLIGALNEERVKVIDELEEKLMLTEEKLQDKISASDVTIEELYEKLRIAINTKRPKECEPIIKELENYELIGKNKDLFIKVKTLVKKYKFKDALLALS